MIPLLPDGYVAVASGRTEAFAWSGAEDWLEAVIRGGGTLADWATGAGADPLPGGRGATWSLAAPLRGPEGRARWICRHYRRGGAVAPLLGDRYLAGPDERPARELRASVTARARGVRTPAVVAGAVYRGGPFYRADLVTERIEDAPSLAESLARAPRGSDRSGSLHAAGRLTRALEAAGMLHADLNATNVLIEPSGEAWVIDLDRCAVVADGSATGDRMRRRLERSLHKLGARGAIAPLEAREWSALCEGFEVRP